MLHNTGVRLHSIRSSVSLRWGGLLVFLGMIERLCIRIVYQPVPYADTNAYLRLAAPLSKMTLKGYDGTRVPGYPALLAIAGLDENTAWYLQLVLGLVMSFLIFWIVYRTTASAPLGALVGGLYNLIPGQFLFESNLLSETLTTFFVLLCLATFVALERAKSHRRRLAIAFLLGITASLPGMVRPYFFPTTLWFLPFVWILGGGEWKQRAARLALYSLAPIVIQGGWLLWIRNTYHMISPTVMSGYSLVQHTGEYFEYLPEDAAAIRDTYLQFRDAQITERGVQTNAIWEAIPAMSEASGLGFYDLSRELQRLSIELIRAHPELYFGNVVEGWIDFWKAPVYWQAEAMQSSVIRSGLQILAWIGRGVSVVANAAFLLIVLLAALSARLRRRMRFDVYSLAVAGFVLMISIVQTIVDHGDNPRFLVPLQMVVFCFIARSLWMWLKKRPDSEAS